MTLRIRVELRDVEPSIWRVLDVPATTTLPVLHQVLQVAMGWTDSHLHEFTDGDPLARRPVRSFVPAADLEDGWGDGEPEDHVTVGELLRVPGDTLHYLYDFGDDWRHVLTLESVTPDDVDRARLVDGARACPPEDCGGAPGYEHLVTTVRALADRRPVDADDEEHVHLVFGGRPAFVVLSDLDRFDVDEADALLARLPTPGAPGRALVDVTDLPPVVAHALTTSRSAALVPVVAAARLDLADEPTPDDAAAAVAHYAWLVRHVGRDGVALTSAGYFRPADVEAVAARLDLADEWIGTLNRESHTPAVGDFRRSAQDLGLLRAAKGRVTATAAALRVVDAPVALWRHIATRLVPRRAGAEHDAALVLLLTVAASAPGRPFPAADAGRLLGDLGWQHASGGDLSPTDVRRTATTTSTVLLRTGAVTRHPDARRWDLHVGEHGPMLARAALRAG